MCEKYAFVNEISQKIKEYFEEKSLDYSFLEVFSHDEKGPARDEFVYKNLNVSIMEYGIAFINLVGDKNKNAYEYEYELGTNYNKDIIMLSKNMLSDLDKLIFGYNLEKQDYGLLDRIKNVFR